MGLKKKTSNKNNIDSNIANKKQTVIDDQFENNPFIRVEKNKNY